MSTTTLLSLYDFSDSFSDGQSSQTYTLSHLNAPGSYAIDKVDVYDKVNNKHTYSSGDLAAFGSPTSITVTDGASETAPTITSNGGGDTARVSIAENTTAVTTVTATDPDTGQTLSYSINGGADAGKFTIGSSTGRAIIRHRTEF